MTPLETIEELRRIIIGAIPCASREGGRVSTLLADLRAAFEATPVEYEAERDQPEI